MNHSSDNSRLYTGCSVQSGTSGLNPIATTSYRVYKYKSICPKREFSKKSTIQQLGAMVPTAGAFSWFSDKTKVTTTNKEEKKKVPNVKWDVAKCGKIDHLRVERQILAGVRCSKND